MQNKIKYKLINRCQISGSKNLTKILSLGLIPPVNQMSSINFPLKEQIFFPTDFCLFLIRKFVPKNAKDHVKKYAQLLQSIKKMESFKIFVMDAVAVYLFAQ